MSGAIAVFVKTPGLSPVKTRLAVHLGKENAENFYSLSVQCVQQAVNEASKGMNVQGYFAVAEHSALDACYWKNLPTLWQGEEDGLGERMAHVYQNLINQHDFVILVGSDIPQMTGNDLMQAAVYLFAKDNNKARHFTFGASDDGGFWLIGGNCGIAKSIWTSVTYSAKDTAAQFLKGIEKIGVIKNVAIHRDVDEIDDLLSLQKTLNQIPRPLPAQKKMINFLAKVLQ